MKVLALLLLLTLTACGDPPLTGGAIIGKKMKVIGGIIEDTNKYYIQVKKGQRTGEIQVSEDAWKQAKDGMQWPFEVK